MKIWQIVSDRGIDALVQAEREIPQPGQGEVLVRVRASSLNYRDLATIENPAPRNIPYPRVPNSDGAGDVIETGAGVTRFAVGDRVCGIFFQRWLDGAITAHDFDHALGGTRDGMLAEYVVLPEHGLVQTPAHLSDIEAATLPCAAVTAWNSMVVSGAVTAGSRVLLLGTGGVSVLALQICGMLGAQAIVTSSSEEKLARAHELGAWATINYRTTPDWEQRVIELTDGRGVDHTVEVGGAGTLAKSILATRVAGSIGLIGILTGGLIDPTQILRRSLRVQGIYVGSRRMFEDLNRAIEAHGMHPAVDQVYPFEAVREACHALRAQGHFGKLVISL